MLDAIEEQMILWSFPDRKDGIQMENWGYGKSNIISEKVIPGRNHRMGKNCELSKGRAYSLNNDFH